jgi:hypothetical protein
MRVCEKASNCLISTVAYPKEYVQNLESMFSAFDEQTAESLRQAEILRAAGERGYSLEEFVAKMRQAIATGAAS